MKFTPSKLPGVVIVDPAVFKDPRGFFFETYQKKKFAEAGIDVPFVQDNYSKSTKNTLRGLHMQVKQAQGKLVRVVRGEVLDVAVDVRVGSPTFKNWETYHLSAENFRQVYIPAGYAHGFLVLSDEVEFEYKCTDYYAPQDELGIRWNDPDIGVKWDVREPVLSEKDKSLPFLKDVLDRLPHYTG